MLAAMQSPKELPAVFMRGGTSRGLVVRAQDLPDNPAQRDRMLLRAMGSPDPFARQLDGMGSGSSSTSKVCVVGPAGRADADLDYEFLQVRVDVARVEDRGNCGNMIAAVAAFAVDEGLVPASGDEALVRIHNRNTGRLIHARVPLADGRRAREGDCVIPGVPGAGAAIALDFREPGGAITGALLPTGSTREIVEGVAVSCVDAANACVFVPAASVGLTGTESPDALAADSTTMARLLELRAAAAVATGIHPDIEAARAERMIPYLGIVAPSASCRTLDGQELAAEDTDLQLRVIASGQPHRAVPLTIALCTAVAAAVEGTVVRECLAPGADVRALRLGMPSGVLRLAAEVEQVDGAWVAHGGRFERTARVLMRGAVALD